MNKPVLKHRLLWVDMHKDDAGFFYAGTVHEDYPNLKYRAGGSDDTIGTFHIVVDYVDFEPK